MSEPPLRVLRADNPSPLTLDGTRTVLLGHDRPLIIDPGPRDPLHLEAILHALRGRPPLAILLTHTHADHAGGALELAERTGTPIRVGPGAPRFTPDSAPIRAAADGELLETEVGPVTALHTPGHTPEHLSFHWTAPDASSTIFVGDLLLGAGETTLVAAPEGDLADYFRSLERIESFAAGRLVPAHGPPILDPQRRIERFRAHRLARLEAVRNALSANPWLDEEQLLEQIYGPELDPRLRRAAAASLATMVRFLRAFGGFEP